MVLDVSRTFFYAPIKKVTFVELPDEENLGKSKFCGKLKFRLYGTLEAPQNWADYKFTVDTSTGLTFSQGSVSALKYVNSLTFGEVNSWPSVNTVITDAASNHYIEWVFKNTYTFSRVVIEACQQADCPTNSDRNWFVEVREVDD